MMVHRRHNHQIHHGPHLHIAECSQHWPNRHTIQSAHRVRRAESCRLISIAHRFRRDEPLAAWLASRVARHATNSIVTATQNVTLTRAPPRNHETSSFESRRIDRLSSSCLSSFLPVPQLFHLLLRTAGCILQSAVFLVFLLLKLLLLLLGTRLKLESLTLLNLALALLSHHCLPLLLLVTLTLLLPFLLGTLKAASSSRYSLLEQPIVALARSPSLLNLLLPLLLLTLVLPLLLFLQTIEIST